MRIRVSNIIKVIILSVAILFTIAIPNNLGQNTVVVEAASKVKYGTVNGNVTYHYNEYQGYKPDTGARVYLIPKKKCSKKGDSGLDAGDLGTVCSLKSSTKNKLKKYGIYVTKVDGSGNFKFSHIPTGKYYVYIISKETTTKGWFDNFNDNISDATDKYYKNVSSRISKYYNKDLSLALGKGAGCNAYAYENVTVYVNEDSPITYEFGYTYI